MGQSADANTPDTILGGRYWHRGAALLGFLRNGGLFPLWAEYSAYHAAIAPLLTLAAGVAVAGVALLRHFAQTEADRQRRITESFSKAIEQLAPIIHEVA
jgi:hypothetical protein